SRRRFRLAERAESFTCCAELGERTIGPARPPAAAQRPDRGSAAGRGDVVGRAQPVIPRRIAERVKGWARRAGPKLHGAFERKAEGGFGSRSEPNPSMATRSRPYARLGPPAPSARPRTAAERLDRGSARRIERDREARARWSGQPATPHREVRPLRSARG